MTMQDYKNPDEIKLPISVGQLVYLFDDLDDNHRMAIIRSLIWTSEDMHLFHEKVCKELSSNKFKESLD